MQTIYHAYSFDLNEPEERKAWEELKSRLEGRGGPRCFETLMPGYKDSHCRPELDGVTLTLETDSLFSDQWNTAPVPGISDLGLRVFDWALDYPDGHFTSKRRRRGHWLELTAEMRQIRRATLKCGYCGKLTPAADGQAFCYRCVGSEYLKESHLHLLRLLPVEQHLPTREPLTDEERALLLPLYEAAQTTVGERKRLAERERVLAKYKKQRRLAGIERKGMLWLLDRGLPISNVIFYEHSGQFGFGWRSPVSDAFRKAIAGFPYPHEIK